MQGLAAKGVSLVLLSRRGFAQGRRLSLWDSYPALNFCSSLFNACPR